MLGKGKAGERDTRPTSFNAKGTLGTFPNPLPPYTIPQTLSFKLGEIPPGSASVVSSSVFMLAINH